MWKKAEWPGIATAVGIVLILSLVIVGSRDDFHLKDYAAVLAAFVAVGGALIAYSGAMAKVYQDRDRDRRELDRKKIGLYLRLLYPIARMNERAEDARKALAGYRMIARKFPPSAIRLDLPEEVEEAWKNLELFPVEVAVALDVIRTEMPKAKRLLDTFPENSVIEVSALGVGYGEALRPYVETCEKIEAATAKLITSLGQEVVRIRSLEWSE
jgi:hypothetical protein